MSGSFNTGVGGGGVFGCPVLEQLHLFAKGYNQHLLNTQGRK